MKNLLITLIVSFSIYLAPIKIYSQELQINSKFTNDTIIFPFRNIENISSITMEGNVHLNNDTSMVRVVLEDENGFQYMIFETYSLICPNLFIEVNSHCDETCLLDQVNPYSIIIQVIDAELNLKNFYYTTEPKENSSEERYKAKRSLDANKIEVMNQLIPSYNMNWTAGDNDIVAEYYDQKKLMFGDGYNLRGYDYYSDGVFEFLGHRNYTKVDPHMVWKFDWRDRHGVNDPSSRYWNGDSDKAGWLTGAKKQKNCKSCWAFAASGVTEAIANLYSAQHIDYNLSEQDLLCNSDVEGSCTGSSLNPSTVFLFIKNTGLITEDCYPYDTVLYDSSCHTILPCTNPNPIVKISDTMYFETENEKNFDSIRKELINKGPLKISYPLSGTTNHAVVLAGFEFNNKDSTLTWIIKNSWGSGGPNKGFEKLKLEYFNHAFAVIPPIIENDTALIVSCQDYDHDGYYFWGIGPRPDTLDSLAIEDCDDNNPFVGGYDENYNCSCIFEMDSVSHHITADTNWSDTTYVNYEVIVDQNHEY